MNLDVPSAAGFAGCKACELESARATSGSHLLQLIQNKTPLITTIVNKFDTTLSSSQHSNTKKQIPLKSLEAFFNHWWRCTDSD
jgi:seryl-tRNA(Sec) selenium transferase